MRRRAGPAAPPESAAGLAIMGGEAVGADGSVARSLDAAGIERAPGSRDGPAAGRAGPARPRTRGVSPRPGTRRRANALGRMGGAEVAPGMARADQHVAPVTSTAMPPPLLAAWKSTRTFTGFQDRL
jgi:hypothetical protein